MALHLTGIRRASRPPVYRPGVFTAGGLVMWAAVLASMLFGYLAP